MLGGRFGWLLLQLLSLALYVKVLGLGPYGIAVVVATYRGFMKLLDLEIPSGTLQRLSAAFRTDEGRAWGVFRTALTLQAAVALAGLVLLAVGPYWAPISAESRAFPDLSAMFAIAGVHHVFDTLSSTLSIPYLAREQFRRLAFFESVLPTFGTLLNVALVLWLRSPLALVAGNALESLVGLGFKVVLFRRYEPAGTLRPGFDRAYTREILSVGWRVYLTNLSSKIGTDIDRVIIEPILGPAAVAVFRLACRIPQIALETLTRLSEAITPNMVATAEHEPHLFPELVRRNVLTVATVASAGIVALGGLGTPLVQTWIRQPAPAGGIVVLLMAAYYGMEQHFSTYTRAFFARNKIQWMLPFTLWNTGVTLLATAPLVRAYGLGGVAAMNVLIDLVQFVPIAWITVHLVAPGLDLRALLLRTGAILGVGFAVALPLYLLTREAAPGRTSLLLCIAAPLPGALTLAILLRSGLGTMPQAIWRRVPRRLQWLRPAASA